ncbi:unnamed protein product [Adineta steineri]|uniref:Carbonic anhydrase n=1 Tax=Adineta steineri TaxID=433720 RepID=A0A819YNP3_9BILA|nr:unnamed protein product [Adineta steineri]CAF4156382.1 unnamed protein product [Adineta steineri]
MNSEWNYGNMGPDVWSDIYPLCSEHSQSPIDIETSHTIYQSFSPFNFSSNSNELEKFKLINNGHTVSGIYIGNNKSSLTLNGGNLNGTFQLDNFHVHWGENYKSGSEHQINDQKYAAEIHFVYLNRKTNEKAVLAMFLKSILDTRGRKTNDYTSSQEWTKYWSIIKNLKEINDSNIIHLRLRSLMSKNRNNFWRYKGSLTTPPCSQGIIWTVFKEPIIVNDHELFRIRKNIFSKNFRSPQRLYNRKVYRSFHYITN